MNECKIIEGIEHLFGIGVGLAISWVALYIIIEVGARLWAWVDDEKTPKDNSLIKFMMVKGFRYEDRGNEHYFTYKKKDEVTNGAAHFFLILFILFFAPFIIVKLYIVVLFIISILLITYLARFVRRHKKLFDKHIRDPEAHKR